MTNKQMKGSNGQTLPTTEVDVVESTGHWSNTKLADGTTLRLTTIVTKAVRVDGQYDPDGNPIYHVNHQTIVNVSNAPDNLKAKVR